MSMAGCIVALGATGVHAAAFRLLLSLACRAHCCRQVAAAAACWLFSLVGMCGEHAQQQQVLLLQLLAVACGCVVGYALCTAAVGYSADADFSNSILEAAATVVPLLLLFTVVLSLLYSIQHCMLMHIVYTGKC